MDKEGVVDMESGKEDSILEKMNEAWERTVDDKRNQLQALRSKEVELRGVIEGAKENLSSIREQIVLIDGGLAMCGSMMELVVSLQQASEDGDTEGE